MFFRAPLPRSMTGDGEEKVTFVTPGRSIRCSPQQPNATHKTPKVKEWLIRDPRFHLHFTPDQQFLAQPRGTLVRRADQPHAASLGPSQRDRTGGGRPTLDQRVERRSEAVRVWTKTADQILETLSGP